VRRKIDIFSAAVGLVLVLETRADLLDRVNDALSIRDPQNRFQLQLSGLIDFEGYFIDQRAPALIETDDSFLFNPRVSLFLDAQFAQHLYFFAQARLDRGFDPSDQGAQVRLDEYFLRYTPLEHPWISFQVGKFATVVGNWTSRHFSWDNPFINAPLPYEHVTGIWDSAAPYDVGTLLYWGHVGKYDSGDYSDKYLRLPIIWGPSYASGFAVLGTIDKFDLAAGVLGHHQCRLRESDRQLASWFSPKRDVELRVLDQRRPLLAFPSRVDASTSPRYRRLPRVSTWAGRVFCLASLAGLGRIL